MTVVLDIAAVLGALIWPLAVVAIFLLFRRSLPTIVGQLPGMLHRIEKVSLGGFSFELAKVAAFSPQWTPTDSGSDLRKSMSSAQVTDSTAGHFAQQLMDPGASDFALVDLGDGKEWLSTRLYILSIVLERAKGVRAFLFVRNAGGRTGRLVGWCEPRAVRWAFAREFPWLEQAFADAYSQLFGPGQDTRIVSLTGALGTARGNAPQMMVNLIEAFLQRVQSPAPPLPHEADQWVTIEASQPTWEHACWLTSHRIEELLGDELNRLFVRSSELDGKSGNDAANRLLRIDQRYVPVVDDEGRFRELIDRQVVLEQVARGLVRSTG